VTPATRPDPYPDLGLQAVREGLGVVVYVRGAFPPELPGSAFVPLEPPLSFPFHLTCREGARSPALEPVRAALRH
jgi:DNA-binding transcriptional LysR family regulator